MTVTDRYRLTSRSYRVTQVVSELMFFFDSKLSQVSSNTTQRNPQNRRLCWNSTNIPSYITRQLQQNRFHYTMATDRNSQLQQRTTNLSSRTTTTSAKTFQLFINVTLDHKEGRTSNSSHCCNFKRIRSQMITLIKHAGFFC